MESYFDIALGYVKLKLKKNVCIIKSKISKVLHVIIADQPKLNINKFQ